MKNRKYIVYTFIPIVFIVGIFIFLSYESKFTEINFADISISVEIADDRFERAIGLSNREYLPENEGMLFVFEREDIYSFWMKDTLIPLDMIWLDVNKKIVYINKNALPESFPNLFTPDKKALYVIETNANFTDKYDIKVGDEVYFSL